MTTELTQIQIEEIITAGNKAKAKNKGKIPYGFNAELGKKYGRTSQSIGQIISGKRRSKKKNNPPKVPEEKEEKSIEKEDSDDIPNYSFTPRKKYQLPSYEELQIFLQNHPNDKICQQIYHRLFVTTRDSGAYRNFYYIIEEMNKEKKSKYI